MVSWTTFTSYQYNFDLLQSCYSSSKAQKSIPSSKQAKQCRFFLHIFFFFPNTPPFSFLSTFPSFPPPSSFLFLPFFPFFISFPSFPFASASFSCFPFFLPGKFDQLSYSPSSAATTLLRFLSPGSRSFTLFQKKMLRIGKGSLNVRRIRDTLLGLLFYFSVQDVPLNRISFSGFRLPYRISFLYSWLDDRLHILHY